jgi:hypothetical protein
MWDDGQDGGTDYTGIVKKTMRDEGQRFGWMSGILCGTGVKL